MTAYPLTWLYAPGDRPQVVAKALASGADVVVVDLEDAVASDRKDYARAATADLLEHPPAVPVHVRVNALDSPWGERDIAALAPAVGLSGLRLAKITSPAEVAHVARRAARADLYALLETALAVEQAYAIAGAHPNLRGIALGEADLRADLGVRDDSGLDWPAPGWSWRPGPPVCPLRPSPSTRTPATWTGWRPPAPTAAPWGSSAGPRSTPVSSR